MGVKDNLFCGVVDTTCSLVVGMVSVLLAAPGDRGFALGLISCGPPIAGMKE